LSKAFCHSPNDRMRTSAFREEAIADHKVEEYKTRIRCKTTGGVRSQI